MQEIWVRSLGLKDTPRREWLPTPVFLPGEFHGQRSLESYSPWGCKELGTTESLSVSLSLLNKCFQEQSSLVLLHRKTAYRILLQECRGKDIVEIQQKDFYSRNTAERGQPPKAIPILFWNFHIVPGFHFLYIWQHHLREGSAPLSFTIPLKSEK